ncbi:MAG: hypothetical protein ACI9SG_002084 [Maribacter sp.]|jgi:hypothetical protein
MNNTVYITLGIVFAIYVGSRFINRGKSRDRKSRKFMEDYKRKEEQK